MSKRHEEIETQKPTMVIESLDHLYRLLVADQSIDHTETAWEQEFQTAETPVPPIDCVAYDGAYAIYGPPDDLVLVSYSWIEEHIRRIAEDADRELQITLEQAELARTRAEAAMVAAQAAKIALGKLAASNPQ